MRSWRRTRWRTRSAWAGRVACRRPCVSASRFGREREWRDGDAGAVCARACARRWDARSPGSVRPPVPRTAGSRSRRRGRMRSGCSSSAARRVRTPRRTRTPGGDGRCRALPIRGMTSSRPGRRRRRSARASAAAHRTSRVGGSRARPCGCARGAARWRRRPPRLSPPRR